MDPGSPDSGTEPTCTLGYTNPRAATTTPTLHGPQGQLVRSIDEKETLIRETAFPQAPGDSQDVEIPQAPPRPRCEGLPGD